jgi:hypothetical protein
MPVRDASARQVVRGELDIHAIARQDPDAIATHFPGGVSESLVTVVEQDLVHAVPECLDDFAFQLDFVFLPCDDSSFASAFRIKRAAADAAARRACAD